MMGLGDGFGVLDKAAKLGSSSSEAGELGVGKQLQSCKSLKQMMMMMVHRHDNHHRPFLDPPHDEFRSGDHGDGPTTCTNTNSSSSSRPKISDIYDVVVANSSSSPASASVGATTFDIPAINSEISHVTAYKSPGGMAASLKFPFTSAQWKELQRQSLIYKYMMASLPVPPDLLFPTVRNPLDAAASHCSLGSGLNLRFSGRGDVEPGRCRRTDGKKWRCSRDVAPGQKYCERHMHRGRPRSRKPVELPKKKTRHSHTQDLPSSPSTVVLPNSCITANASPSLFLGDTSQPFYQNQTTEYPGVFCLKSSTFGSMASITSSKESRSLDWMMNRESVSMASMDQHWQHPIQQTKIAGPSNSPVLNQSCSQEPLSYSSYVDFGKDQEINNCPLFLNPDIVPLEKPHEIPGRSFIDAWSGDGHNANSGNKTDEKLRSLSPLSLSVGGTNMDHIHIGLGVTDRDQNKESGARSHFTSWLAPPPWTAPTPGGPLAEVLRVSKVARASTTMTEASSNPLSPISKNDDPCSPSMNAMSSPSGVLHRTLASISDSSGSSSPTLPFSRAKPEIGLLLLSQGRSASST